MSLTIPRLGMYKTETTCPECEGRVEFIDQENCIGADHEGQPIYSYVTGYYCMDNEDCWHYNEPIDRDFYEHEE